MKKHSNEKRQALKTLSNAVIQAAKFLDVEAPVNDLLFWFAYDPDDVRTWKSFNGWKREGFTVRKGSKAFPVWGHPVTSTKTDDAGEHEDSFFPLAFLFNEKQVFKPMPAKLREKISQPVAQVEDFTREEIPTL